MPEGTDSSQAWVSLTANCAKMPAGCISLKGNGASSHLYFTDSSLEEKKNQTACFSAGKFNDYKVLFSTTADKMTLLSGKILEKQNLTFQRYSYQLSL